MDKKTGFILHYDMLENIILLGNETAVEVLNALSLHDQGKSIGKLSPTAQFAFNAYRATMDSAKKRWEAQVNNPKKRRGKGKPAEANDEPTEAKPSQSEPTVANSEPTLTKPSQLVATGGVNDHDHVNDLDNVNDPEKETDISCEMSADGSDEPPPLSDSHQSALELSELLLTTHRKEIPDYLSGKDKTTLSAWAEDIEKLIRIDKKPPETIREVILWAKRPGNFWFPNIMSGKKLRDKFETLYGQMITGGKRHGTGPPQFKIKSDNIPDDELSQYFTEA